MSDYISRTFMESLGAKCIAVRDEKTNELIAITGIDKLPSADVQPVVHCFNCKCSVQYSGVYVCDNPETPVHFVRKDFGCIYGKRKGADE